MDNKCSRRKISVRIRHSRGDDDLFAAANKGVLAAAAAVTIFHRRLYEDRPNVRSFCEIGVRLCRAHNNNNMRKPCTYIIYTRDISYYNNILYTTPYFL